MTTRQFLIAGIVLSCVALAPKVTIAQSTLSSTKEASFESKNKKKKRKPSSVQVEKVDEIQGKEGETIFRGKPSCESCEPVCVPGTNLCYCPKSC